MNEHNRTKTTLIPSYTLTIVLFFPIFIWISIRVSTRQVSNPVCVDSSIRTACEIILWANTRRKKNYVFAFLYTLPWNLLLILIWISIRVSTNQVRNSVGVESRFRTCLRNYPMNESNLRKNAHVFLHTLFCIFLQILIWISIIVSTNQVKKSRIQWLWIREAEPVVWLSSFPMLPFLFHDTSSLPR